MRKVKILFVITKLELGGAQKQLLALIGNLDREKFTPFLFTTQEGLLMPDALSISGLTLKKSRWLRHPIRPLEDILSLIELSDFIRKEDIKIAHTHSSKAGILGRLAARLARAPIIIHTVHGWSFNDFQNVFKRIFFIWLERLAAKFTDKIIVVSDHDKQKGLNNRIGKENQYIIIRYGISHADFVPRENNIRKEFGISNNDLVVGMVACFKPQKCPQDFVRLAFLIKKELPRVKFILVGDGILRPEIERLARKLNLQNNLILSGWRRDVPEMLSAIDVFALASLWEGLPISVLEAMAAAKPVVATRTGGIEEIVVEGKTGFLVEPKDIEGMRNKLMLLLNDSGLRVKMGQDAAKSLDYNFSSIKMAQDSQHLYWATAQEKSVLYAS